MDDIALFRIPGCLNWWFERTNTDQRMNRQEKR
jgi:hypothetical protein